MSLKRTLFFVLLLATFALMQMGVVTHEISHVKGGVYNTSVAAPSIDESQPPSPLPDSTTHEHCAQCLAYAQVDAVVASGDFNVYFANSVYFISTAYVAYLAAVTKGVYQARAPPYLNSL